MKNRYVTYRLGDNDFSRQMHNAVNWLVSEFGTDFVKSAPDELLLKAMASLMAGDVVALNLLRNHPKPPASEFDYTWYVNYFVSAKIDRTDEGATADGGGGYVSIDCATGYTWIH
jgi:hypothetical protein